MGMFDFLRRRKDREAAIPKQGTPEYEEMISGSRLPETENVEMGDDSWTSVGDARSAEEVAGGGAAESPPVPEAPPRDVDAEPAATRAEEQASTILAEVDKILREASKDPPREGHS